MLKKLLTFLGLSAKENAQTEKEKLDEQIRLSFEQFQNRPIYKELTAAIIDQTSDDDLLQLVFDNLCENLPEDYTETYETVLTFTESQQAIYAIWCLEAEINNGGFNQYFYNPGGEFAPITPGLLQFIGATQFAKLVANANLVYETEFGQINMYQDGTLEGFSESYNDNPLNKFDTQFYELSKVEDLRKLQIDHIRNNKRDFVHAE